MNFQIVSSILKGKWAIDPQFAINSLPLVSDLLSGKIEIEPLKNATPHTAIQLNSGKTTATSFSDPKPHSFALIQINGSLFKADQACGPHGMATMGALIQQADANPNFDGIILQIDSPGGTVDGTEELANIVKNTQKPVVTYVDGLMASAALWIGSSADRVVAATEFAEIGSVGVLLSFSDIQPAYEKLGVKFHTITAPQSTEKVKMWEDLRAGKYEDYKTEVLAPIADQFITVVKSNRPNVQEQHLKGKVFFAKDVMDVFVDRIGDLSVAINELESLIEERNLNSNQNTSQMSKPEFSNINRVVGAVLEVSEDGVHLNQDQLADLDASLSEDESAPELQTALDLAQQDLADANATIAEQSKQIVTLKGKPAVETAPAVTKKDKDITSDKSSDNVSRDSNSFMENLDAVAEEYAL